MVVFGEEMQNWINATFGLVIFEGTPGPGMGDLWGKTKPWNKVVSSIVPPFFLRTLIKFKSTLSALSMLATDLIALRAIGASSVEFWLTILDAREVLTHSINWSSSLTSTVFWTSSMTFNASFKAT